MPTNLGKGFVAGGGPPEAVLGANPFQADIWDSGNAAINFYLRLVTYDAALDGKISSPNDTLFSEFLSPAGADEPIGIPSDPGGAGVYAPKAVIGRKASYSNFPTIGDGWSYQFGFTDSVSNIYIWENFNQGGAGDVVIGAWCLTFDTDDDAVAGGDTVWIMSNLGIEAGRTVPNTGNDIEIRLGPLTVTENSIFNSVIGQQIAA